MAGLTAEHPYAWLMALFPLHLCCEKLLDAFAPGKLEPHMALDFTLEREAKEWTTPAFELHIFSRGEPRCLVGSITKRITVGKLPRFLGCPS